MFHRGVQIVERGGKIHEENKNEGKLEGEGPPRSSPPVFPVYNLINSLPTYRRDLLSERLEQATDSVNTETTRTKYIFKAI